VKTYRLNLSFFCLFFLLSCANSSNHKADKNTITIKDYFDREIQVPVNMNRVITLGYVQAEMICVIGESRKLVAIGKPFGTRSPIIYNYYPRLLKLPVLGNQGYINYEKIISLKPDIVICGPEKAMTERLDQLNVNNIATYPRNPMQVSEQIILLGKILNQSENALKVVNFLNNEYMIVTNRTKNIKVNERPKVYYARTDLLTTLGGGIFSEIINLIGGVSVTKDLPDDMNGVKVSLENIYEWNPDIIIVRDRASITPDDLYKDERLKCINAVKNKQIYQETFSWTEFRMGMYFGMIEKAKWLHPDLFRDIDPKKEYKDFVQLFQSFNL
jgi:iron complex transport system substrate-binding protein